MSEDKDKLVFDDEERALIRAQLFAYAEQHALKPDNLCKRMAEAAGREARFYPRSTLLRFLADNGRTSDSNVTLYKEFLDSLPEPPALTTLGSTLSAFFTPPSFPYDTFPELTLTGGEQATWVYDEGGALEPHSAISFVSQIGPHVFQVEETVTIKEPIRDGQPFPPKMTRIPYQGIALFFHSTGIILQRHVATRHPRTTHFHPNPSTHTVPTLNYHITILEIPYKPSPADTPDKILTLEGVITPSQQRS